MGLRGGRFARLRAAGGVVSIFKRGNVWWLDLADPQTGERIRESTKQRDRARAQRVHDEFKAALWKEQRSGTLHGALRAWAQGKGESDRYHAAKLERLTPENPSLAGLDTDALAKLLPQKPGTFNRYVNVLRAAGIKGIKRKKNPPGRIRWLTSEEWTDLRAALPEQWLPMADFAIATGLRQANVFWLEWSNVDMLRRRAWIHAEDAKGGEAIGVPLSDAAMAVLERQEGLSDVWVFPMRNGNPLPKLKSRDWKAVIKKAKIAACTWHDLRHTWATWHLMAGTPLEVLQKLGGWKDLRMVLRYAHLAASHIDQYAENARPYTSQSTAQSA